MKLLDFIFAKPKKQEEKPKWIIETHVSTGKCCMT
ncbi:hypothetical protein SAG0087_05970 [Streptococcus agalactiae LMG 15091]|nr:hypothetical protein SAG0087_05970 [Streptococcus agalactiae LMG 15091]